MPEKTLERRGRIHAELRHREEMTKHYLVRGVPTNNQLSGNPKSVERGEQYRCCGGGGCRVPEDIAARRGANHLHG